MNTMDADHLKPTVEIFFSRRFPENVVYSGHLKEFLAEHNVDCDAYEIEDQRQRWAETGLRSVPSVLIRVNGKAISNIVKYASFEYVLNRIQKCSANVSELTSPPVAAVTAGDDLPDPNSLTPLSYVVIGSSGCHRYERWNEHSVMDENPLTGWVCPGGLSAEKEYLHFDFENTVKVNVITLKPRTRNDGTPSYKSFPKALSVYTRSTSSKWKKVWKVKDIYIADLNKPFPVHFAKPVECKEIKLVIEEKHDIDGKTFPCITNISFFGQQLKSRVPGSIRYELSKKYSPNVFLKTGIFAQDQIRIELHNLLKDQVTPANYLNKYKILIPLEGAVESKIGSETNSAKKGQIIVIRPRHAFQVRGINKNNRLLVIFSWDGLDSFWESR